MDIIKYKTILYRFFWIFVLTGIGVIGCDNFSTLNTPKNEIIANNLDENTLGKTFAKAEYWGYSIEGETFQRFENLYSDLYAQYFATEVKYFPTDQFDYTPAWVKWGWDRFYSRSAPQMKLVLDYTKNHNMPVAHAVGQVYKVAMYAKLTDAFGPIIYFHFGNGKNSVAYDSQKSVYNSFFTTLDSAVTVLQQNTDDSVFPSDDLLYDGNTGQWLTFANSLRLRLAMRIVYVESTEAKKEAEKAIRAPGGVIEDNVDNTSIQLTKINVNPHAIISQYAEYKMSAALVSALKGYKDPRLSHYMNPAPDGEYHGLRNGLPVEDRGQGTTNSSFIDTKWRPLNKGGTNPPWHIMDASEVYFLRAEGALRGWDNMGGTAKQLYNKGIRASLKKETSASSSEIDKYINSTNKPNALNDKWNSPPVFNIPVKFRTGSSFEKKLEQIISQKWLALYPNGWEAWTERRRTGYPRLYPLIESVNPDIPRDAIIRRLKFSSDEYLNNGEAVQNAIKLLRTPKDGMMVRVWWDAKKQKKD